MKKKNTPVEEQQKDVEMEITKVPLKDQKVRENKRKQESLF